MKTSRAPDEWEIIERLRAGDRGAFETVFRSQYAGLLRFARAQLGSVAEAEDAVHDVFLRVWRDRRGLRVERSLRTYLLAAVRNRVIDLLRRRSVEARWTDDRLTEVGRSRAGASRADPVLPAREFDPAELAEIDRAIRRAVAALPERGRAAFLLCREQELTYTEAADVMGVSPATVKTHMARALAALRAALEPFLLLITVFPLVR